MVQGWCLPITEKCDVAGLFGRSVGELFARIYELDGRQRCTKIPLSSAVNRRCKRATSGNLYVMFAEVKAGWAGASRVKGVQSLP